MPVSCAIAAAAFLAACQPTAPAPPTPTPIVFANPQPVTIQGYQGFADEPFISRDGKLLFWNDQKTIYYALQISSTTFTFAGPVKGLNPAAVYNGVPSMDSAGNFYWLSTVSPQRDRMTLYRGVFKDGTVTGNTAVRGILGDQPGVGGMDAAISADGQTLYHTQDPPPTFEVAGRNADGSFTKLPNSDALLASITADGNHVYAPEISADGLELYYTAIKPKGGIHVARRNSTSEPFGTPEFIAGDNSEAPSISPDGKRLYYGHEVAKGVMQIFVRTKQ